jgi:hypothetical protein
MLHPMKKILTPTFGLLALCLALWVALILRQNTDHDIGFHLKGGQWIAQNHSVPRVDTFTYTVPGHSYVDIHWLYQLTLYGLYKWGGYKALTLFNGVLVVLLFFILLERFRLTVPWKEGAPFFLALIALGIEYRFLLRPEILSWVFLALTLLVLDARFWRKGNFLKALPLIHLVWANTHGLFVLGWIAMAAYLLSGFLRDRKLDKPLAVASGLSVLATLANPYFLEGALYPFLTQVPLQGANVVKQTLSELLSPWSQAVQTLYPDGPLFLVLYKILFVLALPLAALSWRKLCAHEWILLAAYGYLSAVALRNISLFMLVAVPILARLIPSEGWNRRLVPACQGALGLFLAVTIVRVCHNAYYISNQNPSEFGLGISESFLPVQAARFLADHHLDGRMINSNTFGGWLEWEGFKASIDGRVEVMGNELYSDYLYSALPGALPSLVRKYNASIIVADHWTDTSWVSQMANAPGWRLVYFDEHAAVYLRQDYRPDVPDADFQALFSRHALPPLTDAQVDGLLRQPRSSWLENLLSGILRKRDQTAKFFYLANFASNYQRYGLAERFLLEGLRLSRGQFYSFYNRLSLNYLTTKQWNRARWSLQKALEFGRDVPKLEEALRSIPDNPR